MPYLFSVLYSLPVEVDIIIISVLQNRKPWLKEVKQLAHGQIVVRLHNWL